MKTSTQFFDIVYRTVRVIPAFVCMAIAGTFLIYVTHFVPADQAAILLGVPMVWGFAITRVLTLVLPAGRHRGAAAGEIKDGVSVPAWFIFAFVALFVTWFAAVDGVLSAFTFRMLGHRDLAQLALNLTESSAVGLIFVLTAISVFLLRNTMLEMSDALLLGLWKILLLPRSLADSIPGLVQHGHRNH